MRNLAMALRSLFKKGHNNIIKICSLGIGLAVGLTLISKIYFEQSYDNFFPAADRICRIQETISVWDKGDQENVVPAAVAPDLKAQLPEIEAATRFTPLEDDRTKFVLFTEDKNRYEAEVVLADSCLFDVLWRPMVAGNAKEVLSRPMYALVCRSLADKIGKGGEVVGTTFQLDNYPGRELTIGGVFEDVPENSHIRLEVVISIASISKFMWTDMESWLGNDRFYSYLKLRPGVDPKSLQPRIDQMLAQRIDPAKMKANGIELSYWLLPLTDIHKIVPEARRTTVMLGLLAFALLFTAMMNYILIVISSMVSRSREVAIQKCYGATGRNISGVILTETGLHLLLSLCVAILLVVVFRGTAEELLATSLPALLSWQNGLLLLGVCTVVFCITGLIPSGLFARIPVTMAFRNYSESKRRWKRVLLFIQFTGAAFLTALLIIVARQYDRSVNDNPGYTYDRLLYCMTEGVPRNIRIKAFEELQRLSVVEQVGSSEYLPALAGNSGSMVYLNNQTLFNFEYLYAADSTWFPTMGIRIVEGKMFGPSSSAGITQIMVSQCSAKKLIQTTGWTDGVVGKLIKPGGYGSHNCLITGVYNDIRLGRLGLDERPSLLAYSSAPLRYLMVRLHEMSPSAIRQVSQTLTRAMPGKDIVVIPYKTEIAYLYNDARLLRNSVLIGGIVTLLIALIGLVGYVHDETTRRRKEIAIRKINGATAREIIRLLSRDVLLLALPATALGAALAYLCGERWLAQFAVKTTLSPLIFIAAVAAVTGVILATVALQSWRIATENPAKTIKSE